MEIALYTYIALQLVNIFFTAHFGFKDRLYQPPTYPYSRSTLKALEIIFVVAFAFSFVYEKSALFLILLVSPFIIELCLFIYCTSREKQRLIKLFMNPGDGNDAMDQKTATETASSMVADRVRDKNFFF